MRSTLLFLALAFTALAQPAIYTAYDSGTLSTQATTLTVQHTAGSVKNVTIVGVYVECASCSVQLSRSGTAASTTITATAPQSKGTANSEAQAYKTSNVGAGTNLGQPYAITGWKSIALSTVLARGVADNFNVSIASTSGAYAILIQYTEN
jgi:hypothetical protein